jgi:hypothetical protein
MRSERAPTAIPVTSHPVAIVPPASLTSAA